MKYPIPTFVALCFIMLLHASPVRAENTMTIGGQALPLGPADLSKSVGMSDVEGEVTPPTPGFTAPTTFFRDVPSISGRYSFGGQMFLPYVGAGFRNGYTSDLDRSLNSALPTVDPGLRTQFGQGLTPNEFQMGIRVPF